MVELQPQVDYQYMILAKISESILWEEMGNIELTVKYVIYFIIICNILWYTLFISAT